MKVVTQRNDLKGWISQGDHLSQSKPTWSPESSRFALADSMGNIHIWDLNHRDRSQTIPYTGTPAMPLISYLAWSPDGKYLAHGQVSAQDQSYSGRLQIIEITNGNSSEQYMGLHGRVTSLDWSPDSRYLAVGSNEGDVQIWDNKAPDKPRYTYSSDKSGRDGAKLRWSPDGKQLAITSDYGHIVLWSPFTNKRADLEPKSPSSLSDLAWSSNGKYLAALGDDGITFWDLVHSTPTFVPYVNILAVRWQDDNRQVIIVDQYNNTSTLARPDDSSEK
ncbi:hypothetical protein KSX_32370 [Ktedonospora formicarum]|uniref:Uncharacterized protein n=2 Tax=Ktedonospora formicarum TaxID=2778364 RepID=A0A8J3HWJ1_9CHLR|nr:hypothetical protein KSX_32370 [Ktedonospora formicarum]